MMKQELSEEGDISLREEDDYMELIKIEDYDIVTDAPMDITSRCVTAYSWTKTDSLNNSVDTDSSGQCFFHLYASRFFISSRNDL